MVSGRWLGGQGLVKLCGQGLSGTVGTERQFFVPTIQGGGVVETGLFNDRAGLFPRFVGYNHARSVQSAVKNDAVSVALYGGSDERFFRHGATGLFRIVGRFVGLLRILGGRFGFGMIVGRFGFGLFGRGLLLLCILGGLLLLCILGGLLCGRFGLLRFGMIVGRFVGLLCGLLLLRALGGRFGFGMIVGAY